MAKASLGTLAWQSGGRMICDVRPSRIITATAPIRICDIGGWTDTWVARQGQVLNIAVQPLVFVRVEVFPRGTCDAHVTIDAQNYHQRYSPALEGATWGPHPLLEAALRTIPPPESLDVEVTIRSDAPPGASTGTSAAVQVALLGALDCLAGGDRSARQIAGPRSFGRNRSAWPSERSARSTVFRLWRRQLHPDRRLPARGRLTGQSF